MRKLLLIATCCATVAAPAHADRSKKFRTVQGLLDTCTTKDGFSFSFGDCMGYLAGILDPSDGDSVCEPENVSYGQEVAVFTTWARRNPQKWNENSLHAIQAFEEAWPCK
jgi:hypothetical protein